MNDKNNNKYPKLCANCKYWDCYGEEEFDKYGDVSKGECRRYPPSVPCIDYVTPDGTMVPIITMMTPLMTNPFVFAGNWCGEFKLMDNPRWEDDE